MTQCFLFCSPHEDRPLSGLLPFQDLRLALYLIPNAIQLLSQIGAVGALRLEIEFTLPLESAFQEFLSPC